MANSLVGVRLKLSSVLERTEVSGKDTEGMLTACLFPLNNDEKPRGENAVSKYWLGPATQSDRSPVQTCP